MEKQGFSQSAYSPPSPILTSGEVAKLLGVAETTVRRYAENNIIPCKRIGRKYVFTWAEIEQWRNGQSLQKSASGGAPGGNVFTIDANGLTLRISISVESPAPGRGKGYKVIR